MKSWPLLLALPLLLGLSACEEIPPVIPECQTQRVVLIEEFTGVQCVNCPTGSEKLSQLLEQYGAKLIAVSIHSGFFSVPYLDSPEDFTTEKGENIDAMIGPVTGYPAATINRKIFREENQRPLAISSWAGYIGAELCQEPSLLLQSSVQYDSASRQAQIEININPRETAALGDPVGLTVMITEDGVVAPQATLQGKEPNYIHKHILRSVVTAHNGKTIYEAGISPSLHQERFTTTLAAHWNPRKCHVIAFVHYKGNPNMAVIQAHEQALWAE